MKTKMLHTSDLSLIELVAQATFANPFTDRREELDRQITKALPGEPRDQILEKLVEVITGLINRLDADGRTTIQAFPSKDQHNVTYLYLFMVYHHFRYAFDAFIEKQMQAGTQRCQVPFGPEAIAMLVKRGISEEEAAIYFAFFYQVRRAFYFIDRSLPGESECIKVLRRSLWNNVFTHDIRWYSEVLRDRMEDFSTLLLGETGTGKGSAAAAIGRSGFIPFDLKQNSFSMNIRDLFVQINLSQFPEALIESELFGHTKGSFTGAVESHNGIFSLSSPHGAIFLDEIGDVSIPIQIKLLQVLQERMFSPVGSHEKKRFEGRVIAATNHPLEELRRSGKFRDDFYYRLCSDIIIVPPLRLRIMENPKELEILLHILLRRLTGEDIPELYAMVFETLKQCVGLQYHWPGNVRELEQCVRRILLTRSYTGDTPRTGRDLLTDLLAEIQEGTCDAKALLGDYCRLLYQRHGSYQEVSRITGLDRRTVKKHITLSAADGNKPAGTS